MNRLLSLSALLLLLACGEKQKSDTPFRHVSQIANLTDTVLFNDLFADYKYVRLENSPECKVGDINQMLLSEKDIYLVTSRGIYCFDMEGEFRFKAGERGHGRGEFVQIDKVSYSEGKLYLHDNPMSAILVFDGKSGQFEKKIEVMRGMHSAYVTDGQLIGYRLHIAEDDATTKDKEKVLIFEQEQPMEVIASYFPEGEELTEIALANKGCIGIDGQRYKAYKVSREGKVPYYEVSLPIDMRLSEADIEANNREGYIEFADKVAILRDVIESEQFIHSTLYYNRRPVSILHDKKSNKSRVLNIRGVALYQMLSTFEAANKEYMAASLDASYLCMVREMMAERLGDSFTILPEDHPAYEGQQLLLSAQPDDNPLVLLYKFKPIE